MGQKRQVQRDGSKETDPNRRVQINWSKKTDWSKWSNMVQNQTKKCPNGSGITRSPGLVCTKMTISPRKVRHVSARRNVHLRPTANYLHIDILDQNLKKV